MTDVFIIETTRYVYEDQEESSMYIEEEVLFGFGERYMG